MTDKFVSTSASAPVEPVVLDHYTEDELVFNGGIVRPLGSGFLVRAGAGDDISFLVADSLVAATRALKTILADKG